MTLSAEEIQALRFCAAQAWRQREAAGLSEQDCNQVLLAWQAIGDATEAEAAARLLAARHEAARKQATFDQVLGKGGV